MDGLHNIKSVAALAAGVVVRGHGPRLDTVRRVESSV